MTQCLFCGRYDNWKNYVAQTISILFIAVAMFKFNTAKKTRKRINTERKEQKKNIKKNKNSNID